MAITVQLSIEDARNVDSPTANLTDFGPIVNDLNSVTKDYERSASSVAIEWRGIVNSKQSIVQWAVVKEIVVNSEFGEVENFTAAMELSIGQDINAEVPASIPDDVANITDNDGNVVGRKTWDQLNTYPDGGSVISELNGNRRFVLAQPAASYPGTVLNVIDEDPSWSHPSPGIVAQWVVAELLAPETP